MSATSGEEGLRVVRLPKEDSFANINLTSKEAAVRVVRLEKVGRHDATMKDKAEVVLEKKGQRAV